jgi:hypothetical protein
VEENSLAQSMSQVFKVAKESSSSQPSNYLLAAPKNRAIVPLHWTQHEGIGRCPASDAWMTATCPCGLNIVHQISLTTVKIGSVKFTPDAPVLFIERTTRGVRCSPVSSPSSKTRIGCIRRITIRRATMSCALQLFCHVPRQQAPNAEHCSASARCKTVRRVGVASQLRST